MGRWLKVRIGFLFSLFALFFGGLIFRLVQLQILPDAALQRLAQHQIVKNIKKHDYRLPILDRNGDELAITIPAGAIFARPKLIRNKHEVAQSLKEILGGTTNRWFQKIKQKKPFVWIQRQVAQETLKEVENKKIPGIYVQKENQRVYPNDSFLAHVLGFTDIDGNGISGLEYSLNKELLNPEGKFVGVKDGKGTFAYIEKTFWSSSPTEGVALTIDKKIQNATEEILKEAAEGLAAKHLLATVIDPKTGEILALAQTPGFDPNEPTVYPATFLGNHWVQSLYEPGSTMKVLLAAQAIEKNILGPKSMLDCGNGRIQIGNKIIREAESDHKFGLLPLEKVIHYSSNIGAVRIGQKLGFKEIQNLFLNFGLNNKVGIPLPGEVVGGLKNDFGKKPFQLATLSFGQGFSVTPVQMAQAFQIIANDGIRMNLRLLKREVSTPKKVLSARTAHLVKEMLVGVTEEKGGTGLRAKVPQIRTAGKTGTAQKYDSRFGYRGKKYFSSFIGFLPADNPKVLVAVMVDEPEKEYYATQTAAPLFRKISEVSLRLLEEPSSRYEVSKEKEQLTELAKITELTKEEDGTFVLPDLAGLSHREVIQLLGKYFPHVEVTGEGYVISQTPAPGQAISAAEKVKINLGH